MADIESCGTKYGANRIVSTIPVNETMQGGSSLKVASIADDAN